MKEQEENYHKFRQLLDYDDVSVLKIGLSFLVEALFNRLI